MNCSSMVASKLSPMTNEEVTIAEPTSKPMTTSAVLRFLRTKLLRAITDKIR